MTTNNVSIISNDVNFNNILKMVYIYIYIKSESSSVKWKKENNTKNTKKLCVFELYISRCHGDYCQLYCVRNYCIIE